MNCRMIVNQYPSSPKKNRDTVFPSPPSFSRFAGVHPFLVLLPSMKKLSPTIPHFFHRESVYKDETTANFAKAPFKKIGS